MLAAAVASLKGGGQVVYSTAHCAEENEAVLNAL